MYVPKLDFHTGIFHIEVFAMENVSIYIEGKIV